MDKNQMRKAAEISSSIGNAQTSGFMGSAEISGPIGRKLMKLREEGLVPFHMPGHKRKAAGPFPETGACDITEITGYDDLHDPRGIILESMNLVRDIFGTRASWYLINGSTAGILASMSAVCRPGDRILTARNCHKAVYNGIRLLRLKPVYVNPPVDPLYRFAGSLDPEEVGRLLTKHPDIKAVIMTSPTYEGIVSDVGRIREIMDRTPGKDAVLIVDEAHGAHFHFHSYFPSSAVSLGADLVIQSTHKTLPAMTQTALLHLCSDRVDPGKIHRQLTVFETSSPSYILLASAEYSLIYMEERKDALAEYVKELEAFRQSCRPFISIRLLENDQGKYAGLDPGKLVFCVKNRGKDLFDRLRRDYGIEAEMAGRSHVVCMTSVMDAGRDFDELYRAVSDLDQFYSDQDHDRTQEGESRAGFSTAEGREERPGQDEAAGIFGSMVENEQVYYSWECEDLPAEDLVPDRAAGRIAAEDIMVYPPGIPVIVAGERFEKEIVENIKYSLYNGYHVTGVKKNPAGQVYFKCLKDYYKGKQGMFIVLEGPDGSGKTTQINRLFKYLTSSGQKCLITREPGGTNLGEQIRKIILNPENDAMADVTEMLLYAAARAQLMEEKIIPALQEGQVVLCDRFLDSSLVYQGLARGLGVEVVRSVNLPGLKGFLPDRVIFLDLPEEEGIRRKKGQKKLDRLEQESMAFHHMVAEGYRKILSRRPDVVRIDAGKTEEEIHQEIVKIISGLDQ